MTDEPMNHHQFLDALTKGVHKQVSEQPSRQTEWETTPTPSYVYTEPTPKPTPAFNWEAIVPEEDDEDINEDMDEVVEEPETPETLEEPIDLSAGYVFTSEPIHLHAPPTVVDTEHQESFLERAKREKEQRSKDLWASVGVSDEDEDWEIEEEEDEFSSIDELEQDVPYIKREEPKKEEELLPPDTFQTLDWEKPLETANVLPVIPESIVETPTVGEPPTVELPTENKPTTESTSPTEVYEKGMTLVEFLRKNPTVRTKEVVQKYFTVAEIDEALLQGKVQYHSRKQKFFI